MSKTQSSQALTTQHPASSEQTTALHVATALGSLHQHYQANIAAFAQELHALTLEIDTAKSEIQSLKENKAEDEAAIKRYDEEIVSELRLIETLNERYIRKLHIIEEIEKELARTTNHKPELHHRYEEIDELREEIETFENALLRKELERQNLILKIEPVRLRIAAIEADIRKLEAQKRHLESAGLHHLSPSLPQTTQASSPEEETIETDIEVREENT